MTLLDQYNMSAFAMVVLLLAVVSLLRNLPISATERNQVDDILFYVVTAALVLMNFLFAARSVAARMKELKKLQYNTMQLHNHSFDKTSTQLIAKPEDALPDCDVVPTGESFASYITLASKDARKM